MTDLNFWPIIVASIVAFAVSALWYSPVLFGKEWLAHLKLTDADIAAAKNKGMTKLYVSQFVLTLVTFTVLGFAITSLGIMSARDGGMLAFIAWLGFMLPTSLGGMLWEKKTLKITLITSISTLICWIIGGAIIGGWN